MTINVTCGYMDSGPTCSKCGTCECTYNAFSQVDYAGRDAHEAYENDIGDQNGFECIGLSFAYCNMDDGSESLCEDCATKAGITITPCDYS